VNGSRKDDVSAPQQQHAALPVVFANTVGLFMPPAKAGERADTAVLFASPWGLEEISTRKFRRVLAEDLSRQGIASLRFDYPGTGDALDPPDFQAGLRVWEDSLVAAADVLRTAGYGRLVVVAQGLGAALTLGAARRIPNLDGIALLAPVLSGRTHLRELALWAKVVDGYLQIREEHRVKQGVAIAGLTMPDEIAADIRKLDLRKIPDRIADNCLLLAQPGQAGAAEFAAHLRGFGAQVAEGVFTGYQELVSNPLTSQIPSEIVSEIVSWACGLKTVLSPSKRPAGPAIVAAEALSGEDFEETPLRFGRNDRLYGIFCRPKGERTGATAILLGSAYDRHSGWGRLTTETARRLAAAGVASLRFDAANVADSPPLAGAPEQVLYDEVQQVDVREAVDYVESRNLLPAIAVGRCSGAYLAFQSTLKDSRLRGLVAVNPYTFHWDAARPYDPASTPLSLEAYGEKIFRFDTIARLLKGEINAGRSALKLKKAIQKKLSRILWMKFHLTFMGTKEQVETKAGFDKLLKDRIPASLVYSSGDIGLDNILNIFRIEAPKLPGFENVVVDLIDGADHNLTPGFSRELFGNRILGMASKV
jgi:alpha-beta hydrolase superfamily lysophospholipase